jgi:hypothetical protein
VAKQRWLLQLEDVYAPTNATPTCKTFYREVYYDQKPRPEKVEQLWLMLGAKVFLDEKLFSDFDEGASEVYCLAATGQSQSGLSGICRYVRGLILKPTGRQKGEYRRLDVFMNSYGNSMNVLVVRHRSEEKIRCVEYDPEEHKHTFTIVWSFIQMYNTVSSPLAQGSPKCETLKLYRLRFPKTKRSLWQECPLPAINKLPFPVLHKCARSTQALDVLSINLCGIILQVHHERPCSSA